MYDHRAPAELDPNESLPQITFLPSHTNVIIINGEPKHPPWTIRDIAPRHHLVPFWDTLPLAEQQYHIDSLGYLPYDIYGNPVLVQLHVLPDGSRKYRHIFRDQPEWEDPVVNNIRTDDPHRARIEEAERTASTQNAAVAQSHAMDVDSRSPVAGDRRSRASTGHSRRDSGRHESHGRTDSVADPNGEGAAGARGGFTAINQA